jgi:hypothetical protein
MPLARSLFLGACAAVLLGAAPAAAQMKQFGEYWTAACDNQRSCAAYGVHFMWQAGYIRIERSGAPEAQPKVTLAILQDKPVKFTLGFDAPAPDILPKGTIAPDRIDEDGYMRFAIEAPIDDVLAALRQATTINYTPIDPPTPDGYYEATITLTGATAALAWIDAQQKRAGTVTALVKRGARPAAAVPPVPELPSIAVARSTLDTKPLTPPVIAQRARTVCGKEERNGELRQPAWLDDTHVMHSFFCMRYSGAYNLNYALLAAPVDNPQAARPAVLRYPPVIAAIEKSRTDPLYNAEFDPATGTLVTFRLGRAAADCGTRARWMWDGTAFRLALLQKMPTCGRIDPQDWPVLYRATIEKAAS